MSKLRQRYDDLKERYGVSDITVSVQSKDRSSKLPFIPFEANLLNDKYLELCELLLTCLAPFRCGFSAGLQQC